MLARVFKDIYPRFQTMRATSSSARAAGTATGCRSRSRSSASSASRSKAEIEAYGIAEFNAKCRESVFSYLEEWNALTERIGFWVDLDDAYRTLDPSYIESVWWALRQISDKGLLYEGHKVVPYCPAAAPRCRATRSRWATATSSTRRSTSASRSPRTAARCRPATSCSSGRRRRGRSSPTPRSRSTPS